MLGTLECELTSQGTKGEKQKIRKRELYGFPRKVKKIDKKKKKKRNEERENARGRKKIVLNEDSVWAPPISWEFEFKK